MPNLLNLEIIKPSPLGVGLRSLELVNRPCAPARLQRSHASRLELETRDWLRRWEPNGLSPPRTTEAPSLMNLRRTWLFFFKFCEISGVLRSFPTRRSSD